MDQSSECQLVLHGMPESTEDNFAGPAGFVQSLRELYERSCWELGLAAEVIEKCLNELTDYTPSSLLTDNFPSTHTKAMWHAGRLDLTIERLALSSEWRGGFLAYDMQEVSRNLRALESLRLARNEPGRIVELDKDVEESGYRLRSSYGTPYLTCRQASLSGYELPFLIQQQQCCESVRRLEEELEVFPVLFGAPLHHLLSCEECAENAPNARLLGGFLLNEAINNVGSMLRNLIECLDLSEGKIKRIAQHNSSGKYYWAMREAATARAFFMALYVPRVSVDLVNCLAPDENALKLLDDSGSGMNGVVERISRMSEYSHDFNPWIRLRDGYGLPEAVRFVCSLSEEAFEAGLLSHELYNISNEADSLAYRWAWPWRRRFIPSTQENLVPIPGFLGVVQGRPRQTGTASCHKPCPPRCPTGASGRSLPCWGSPQNRQSTSCASVRCSWTLPVF